MTCGRIKTLKLEESTVKRIWKTLDSPPGPGLGADQSLFLFFTAELFSREAERESPQQENTEHRGRASLVHTPLSGTAGPSEGRGQGHGRSQSGEQPPSVHFSACFLSWCCSLSPPPTRALQSWPLISGFLALENHSASELEGSSEAILPHGPLSQTSKLRPRGKTGSPRTCRAGTLPTVPRAPEC